MPQRFCLCQGCPACNTTDRKPGSHGKVFNLDTTKTLKCPDCQAIATAKRNTQRNARPKTSTTARGYGTRHRKERERLLAIFQPGDPCAICGKPMTHQWTTIAGKRVSALDLAHNEDRTGWKGLAHARCNRNTSNAGRNASRGGRPAPRSF